MECCRCKRKPIENNLSMIPIEPPLEYPNKGRKWVCMDCATKEELSGIPQDVKNVCSIFDGRFEQEGEE